MNVDDRRRLQLASAANPSLRVAALPSGGLSLGASPKVTVATQHPDIVTGANTNLYVGNKGSFIPAGSQTGSTQFGAPPVTHHLSPWVDLLHNPVTNVVGGAVQFIPQFAENYSNTFANLGNRLAGGQNQTIQQNMGGDPFSNAVLRASGATGRNKQFAGDIAQVAAAAAGGVGSKFAAPAAKLAAEGGVGALFGGGVAGGEQDSTAQSTLRGAGIGGALGVAGGLAGKVFGRFFKKGNPIEAIAANPSPEDVAAINSLAQETDPALVHSALQQRYPKANQADLQHTAEIIASSNDPHLAESALRVLDQGDQAKPKFTAAEQKALNEAGVQQPAYQRGTPKTVGEAATQAKLGVYNVPESALSADARLAQEAKAQELAGPDLNQPAFAGQANDLLHQQISNIVGGGKLIDDGQYIKARQALSAAYDKEVKAAQDKGIMSEAITREIDDRYNQELAALDASHQRTTDLQQLLTVTTPKKAEFTPDELAAVREAEAQTGAKIAPDTSQAAAPGPQEPTKVATDINTQADTATKQAYQQTVKNGGVTINLEGKQPKDGFAYAPNKDTELAIPKDQFSEKNVDDYVQAHFDDLQQPGNHLGLWEDDGKIYIDISRVGKPDAKTIAAAHDANQLAVFDLKNFEEIPIGQIDNNGVYSKLDEAPNIFDQYKGQNATADKAGTVGQSQEVPVSPAQEVTLTPDEQAAAQQMGIADQFANIGGKEVSNQTYEKAISSVNVSPETKALLTNKTHAERSLNAIDDAAQRLVRADPTTTDSLLRDTTLLQNQPDTYNALAAARIQQLDAAGKSEAASSLFDELISSGSKQAQGLNAMKLLYSRTPIGQVKYFGRELAKSGVKLTPEEETSLRNALSEANKIEDPYFRELEQSHIAEQVASLMPKNKTDLFKAAVATPRTALASADLSFIGRQGAILAARFPDIGAEVAAKSARFAVDPAYFHQEMAAVRNMVDADGTPLYPVFKRMGLDTLGAEGRTEEAFAAKNLLEGRLAKKLVVGQVVAASDRAFTGAATVLRAKTAAKILELEGGAANASKTWSAKRLRDMGRVINTASGRGSGKAGGWFEKAAPVLGQTLFSARLWKSRLDALNPVYYAKLDPVARKYAAQAGASFAAEASVVLAAAAAAGASVELDPRSSDFAKIKFGNTRLDILGGLQQNIVLAAREISGTKKNSHGEIVPLQGGFGKSSRFSVASDFVTNKETPVLSTATRIMKGEDIGGNPVNPWREVAKMFIPLNAQDAFSKYGDARTQGASIGKASAQTAGVVGAGTFGIGTQTYGPQPGKADTKNINPTFADIAKTKTAESQSRADFTKTLSAEDKQYFEVTVKGKKTTITQSDIDQAYKAGKLSEDQYNHATSLHKVYDRLGGTQATEKLPKGLDPTAESFYKKYNALTKKGQDSYLNGKADQTAIAATKTLNSQKPPGLDEIPASNKTLQVYAKYLKDQTQNGSKWSAVQQNAKIRTFWANTVKSGQEKAVQDIYSANEGQLRKLLKDGSVTKDQLDKAIALDNQLYKANLIDSLGLSKKFRNEFGYAVPSSYTSGSGSGGGSSSKSTGSIGLSNYLPGKLSFSPPSIDTIPNTPRLKFAVPSGKKTSRRVRFSA